MMCSFSENYINETKKKLALEVLKLVGINSFDEKKYIIYNDLQSEKTLEKIRNMIPALKTVFQISKNRCLSINSWHKSKHPGVNLLRQILKEVGYKLSLINEFQGTICSENGNKKKIYNTKYIIIPYSCSDASTDEELSEELSNEFVHMKNVNPNSEYNSQTNKKIILGMGTSPPDSINKSITDDNVNNGKNNHTLNTILGTQ